jgi:hypothetical protein
LHFQLVKLKEFADSEDYLMKVDEIFLESVLKAGDAEAKIGPIEINDDRNITPYSPYHHSKFMFSLLHWYICRTILHWLHHAGPSSTTSAFDFILRF